MPRVPINFSQTTDTDQTTSNFVRAGFMMNMYPQKLGNGKVIARNALGFTDLRDFTGIPVTGVDIITVNDRIFTVGQSSGTTWKLIELFSGGTFTDRGNFTNALGDQRIRMQSNGLNIVIVTSYNSTNDYTFDLGTNVLATIASIDATYTGFGKAIDVTQINNRYVFNTGSVIFHGDLKTDAGQGINFNALSFAELPFNESFGLGVEFYNGLVYAFSSTETRIYQDVGTTPFSLQLNVSQIIPVGIIGPAAKTVFGNEMYIIGYQKTDPVAAYIISGLQFNKISNDDFLESNNNPTTGASAFVRGFSDYAGAHIIFRLNSSTASNQVFMPEQSQKQGLNIWYKIGTLTADGTQFNVDNILDVIPYQRRKSSAGGTASTNVDNQEFFYGESFSFYIRDATAVTEISTQASTVDAFVITLDYARADSASFFIKKLRLRLIDSAMTAELYYSDGETGTNSIQEVNNFTSLGLLTPGAEGAVEWRRIGRVSEQRSFRIILRGPTSTISGGILDGYIEI